jgi:hypothetical protein
MKVVATDPPAVFTYFKDAGASGRSPIRGALRGVVSAQRRCQLDRREFTSLG